MSEEKEEKKELGREFSIQKKHREKPKVKGLKGWT